MVPSAGTEGAGRYAKGSGVGGTSVFTVPLKTPTEPPVTSNFGAVSDPPPLTVAASALLESTIMEAPPVTLTEPPPEATRALLTVGSRTITPFPVPPQKPLATA